MADKSMAAAIEWRKVMKKLGTIIVLLATAFVLTACGEEPPVWNPGTNDWQGHGKYPPNNEHQLNNEHLVDNEEPVIDVKLETSDKPFDEEGDDGAHEDEGSTVYDDPEENVEADMNLEHELENNTIASVGQSVSREIEFYTFVPGGETALDVINNERLFGIYIDAIPDIDTAVDIADTIFKTMQNERQFSNFVSKYVFYDEEHEIWIVGYMEDRDDIFVGKNLNIALQKSDARVLRIWVGE